MLKARGDSGRAAGFFEQLYHVRCETLGSEHGDTLLPAVELVEVLIGDGQLEKARAIAEDVLSVRNPQLVLPEALRERLEVLHQTLSMKAPIWESS